jgi:hypothetical protein
MKLNIAIANLWRAVMLKLAPDGYMPIAEYERLAHARYLAGFGKGYVTAQRRRNVFDLHADERHAITVATTRDVLNRRIDADIIAGLDAAEAVPPNATETTS